MDKHTKTDVSLILLGIATLVTLVILHVVTLDKVHDLETKMDAATAMCLIEHDGDCR